MNKAFGTWLKERRLELNLTQKDFANKIGIDPVSENYLENGKRSPSFKTIGKVSAVVGVSVMDIRRIMSRAKEEE